MSMLFTLLLLSKCCIDEGYLVNDMNKSLNVSCRYCKLVFVLEVVHPSQSADIHSLSHPPCSTRGVLSRTEGWILSERFQFGKFVMMFLSKSPVM